MRAHKDALVLDKHHGSSSGMTWPRKQRQQDGWTTYETREDRKLAQMQKRLEAMEKATKQMTASTTKLFKELPMLQQAKKEKEQQQGLSKSWKCITCDLLHNNPKCMVCRHCGKARNPATVPKEEEATDGATVVQPAGSGTAKGGGKGKGKGKGHDNMMETLKSLQRSMAAKEEEKPSMEVEQDQQATVEDNAAKAKELQQIIDGLEKMPSESAWVKQSLEDNRAKLAALKAPGLSANAEMAKVLKMEAASIQHFEAQSAKVVRKVAQAKEQMEEAKKLLEEAEQEQKQLKERQVQAKEQFALTKQMLKDKGGGEASNQPADASSSKPVPQQTAELVTSSIAQYAPSKEVRDLGISEEHMLILLKNFASSIVMTSVAQAAIEQPVEQASAAEPAT